MTMELEEASPLNVKQEMFCILYVDYKGNGTQAYQDAYDCDYDTARVNASRLLTNANIRRRLSELVADYAGVTEVLVDFELLKLITQDEKLPVKMQAIREFYKITGRTSYGRRRHGSAE